MDQLKSKVNLAVNKLKRSHDAITNSPGMTKSLLNDTQPEETPKKKLKSSSSTGSLVGSILRKGNKFANLEEFASFMSGGDSKKSSNKKKKNKNASDEANPDAKKSKFDPEKLRQVLDQSLNEAPSSSSTPSKARQQLASSRFRHLNEQLYMQSGAESAKMFKKDKETFRVYHQGYAEQVRKWPMDPLDDIATHIISK